MKVRIAVTSRLASKMAKEFEGNQTERLLAFLEAAGPRGATRLEICAGTGMKHENVSTLATRLCDDGLAHEVGTRANDTGAQAKVVVFGPAQSAQSRRERSPRTRKAAVRELEDRVARLELGLADALKPIAELRAGDRPATTATAQVSVSQIRRPRPRPLSKSGRKVQLADPQAARTR